jgi:hypothetical protein
MRTQRLRYHLLCVGFGALLACSQFETGYFQNKVDQVTQHKTDEFPGGRAVWTYFDRGSSTAGYGGYAPPAPCKAYLLTFDQSGVLRDWKQQDCTS